MHTKYRFPVGALIFLVTALACIVRAADDGTRTVVSLDPSWRFHLGDIAGADSKAAPTPSSPVSPDYPDASWQQVDVPHDYVVAGTFSQKANGDHGFLPVEVGWYRKTISVPATAQGNRVWLEFDGVYRDSKFWLNGKYLGAHASGYTSFRFDITDRVEIGKDNLLTVRVDPTKNEGWFYEGGGIYRHTRLVIVNPLHVVPWGVYVNADVPDPGDGIAADSNVTVETTVKNETTGDASSSVLSEILDSTGAVVGSAQTPLNVAKGATEVATQKIALAKAHLWSVDNPYLYRLRTSLLSGSNVVDQITTPFGARKIAFDKEKGFFLNGKAMKILGTSNHQDAAGVGIAVPDRIIEWRLQKLKEMGCNGYRTTHGPPDPLLLDDCDRLGMLVMDENRHFGDTYLPKSPDSTEPGDSGDLRDLILRDRNHPSIVLWSICNEEQIASLPIGKTIGEAMRKEIKSLDTTRPITAAQIAAFTDPNSLYAALDIVGINYQTKNYDKVYAASAKPIIGSETASSVGTRGIYSLQTFTVARKKKKPTIYTGEQDKGYVSSYGSNAVPWGNTAEDAWKQIADRPFMGATFIWTGFDYRGEPTPFSWPCINSHFGIMDTCGFPKAYYYYYQSWWTDKPVLHLVPHWNWPDRVGQTIPVWCYSNCDTVELFLNGTSLGAQKMEKNGHLVWNVTYQPGTLLAKGIKDGHEITDEVDTTGGPASVALEPDRTALKADNQDVSIVTVRIADEKGRTVPTADNEVSFQVTGPGKIIGVGNGDPSCHEPDKGTERAAFNGLCMVLVQTTGTPGAITLQATSPNLKSAEAQLQSSP
jgi:beta-galactosidase